MSMAYIRRYYGVPAKRGMRVVYGASDGDCIDAVIVGSKGAYLRVRLGNNKHTSLLHPTYYLRYKK